MRLRHRPLWFVCCVSALSAPALAEEAPAAPPAATVVAPPAAPLSETLKGMARAEYEAGKILYADGDYVSAGLKFERAYAESKDARLLWNIAATEKNRRRYARVYSLVEQYLKEAGPTLSEADRADAQALLDTVKGFIGEVTVVVTPPGASISVDDQALGVAPLSAPIRLEMGERRFKIQKPGFADYAQTENVLGGSATRMEVKLQAVVHEGRLRVVASAGDAIRVDGKVVGLGEWEGKLPSGIHSVQVTNANKRPYQSDVGVSDGQLATLRVALESGSSEKAAPIWPWLVGGAAAAAGLSVGAYFLFRPTDQGPPPPIDGTLDPGSIPLGLKYR